jgi:hypothetical protein
MIGYKLAKLKFSTTHYHTTCWNHLNNVKQFWIMLQHIEPLLLTVFVVPVDPKDLCLGCDGHIITSIRFGDSKKVGTKKRPWRGHHYSMCRTAHAACVPMPHGDSKQFYDVHILACSSAVWGWFGHTQQHVNYSLAVKHYHRTDTMGEIKRLLPRWKKRIRTSQSAPRSGWPPQQHSKYVAGSVKTVRTYCGRRKQNKMKYSTASQGQFTQEYAKLV